MNNILTQQVVPISDFRIHQSKTLEKMAHGPVYLAQRSKPVAVLVAAEQWDKTVSRLETLESMSAQQKFDGQFTLPENLLAQISDLTNTEQDLSSFLEAAAWAYITRLHRAEQNARDVEIINANAEYLNSEAMDVLDYQAEL